MNIYIAAFLLFCAIDLQSTASAFDRKERPLSARFAAAVFSIWCYAGAAIFFERWWGAL